MTNWKHHIPVTKFFPEDDTCDLTSACYDIYESLVEHRVFLRYVELPEEEIVEFTDIADDFHSESGRQRCILDATEFDEAMERLYDWADKNQIWID